MTTEPDEPEQPELIEETDEPASPQVDLNAKWAMGIAAVLLVLFAIGELIGYLADRGFLDH